MFVFGMFTGMAALIFAALLADLFKNDDFGDRLKF